MSEACLKLILLLLILSVVAGEYCQYGYSSYYSNYYSTYCSNGCCGTKYSSYSDICCTELKKISSYTGGAIAGIVIGSLAGIAILIGLIVCCCVAANNSSRRTGIVMQPTNTGMQTVVVNSTAFSQGQSTFPVQQGAVGYGYPIGGQPPPYAQGSANPAYPPPQPAKY